REAEPILIAGLRRREYRGYDSAGLATLTCTHLHVRKRAGRIDHLANYLNRRPAPGCHGISHTRWATHGGATDNNAHPHLDTAGLVAVVHNGVIENYAAIKRQPQADGIVFCSETDTEGFAPPIGPYLNGDLSEAVRKALKRLKGTYGLAVISSREPGVIVGARLGSPLVLGIGEGEMLLASDPSALVGHTQKVVYLHDHQMCVLTPEDYRIAKSDSVPVEARVHQIDWGVTALDKGSFDHYMLKEIYEQPEALTNAMAGRLDDADNSARFGGLNLDTQKLRQVDRIIMT